MSPRSAQGKADWFRVANGVLGGLLVSVMLGSSPTTAAYLSTSMSEASNVVATAKEFGIHDLSAVSAPAGQVQLAWSAASWAAGGYSVRRGTTPTGPFTQLASVASGVTAYTDASGVDGTSYSYEVFGLSGAGGTGTGSTIATATADATSPTVSATSPLKGATSVDENATVSITFSEAMNETLTAANLSLMDCGPTNTCDSGSVVSATQGWGSATGASLVPTAPLAANEWYAVRLMTVAADPSGNALSCSGASAQSGSTCYWSFQTGSSSGTPGLASWSPAGGATGVPTNVGLSFAWTAALSSTGQADAQNGFSLEQVSGAGAPCYVFSGSAQTPLCAQHGGTWSNPFGDASQFVPSAALLANTSYTAVESANDTANLSVSATATWTTAAATDAVAPSVSRVVPGDGTLGVSPSATVQVVFSEPMSVVDTEHAFGLQAYSGPGCSGSLGAAAAGSFAWQGSTQLTFYPSAALTADTCYRVSVASTAKDVSGNALSSFSGSTFTVVAGTPPTVSLSGGSYYYPGATLTASGSGWSLGSGNVRAAWDDGSALDSSGAAISANAFSGYAFSLPTNASSGSHTVWFTRSGGASIGVQISVQSPSSLSLSASSTDISAGGSTTISAIAYDQGQPASNTLVTFAITDDAGTRGSFSASGRTTSVTEPTDGSGQPAPVTLYVSAGGSFAPITVTASSGSTSRSITIIDPAPLPPGAVQLTATDQLAVSWAASPSANVARYEVLLGTSSGTYSRTVDAGNQTSYVFGDLTAGQTYYVVVRAEDAHGALSDPSGEAHITLPLPTLTPTATSTATPTPTATATATATSTPTVTATATATEVPTSAPTARPSATATAVPTHTPQPTTTLVATAAASASPTTTVTSTPVATTSPTPDVTATVSPTSAPTGTVTPVATSVPSATATPVATATGTATAIVAATATATHTPVPTFTPTTPPTATPVPTNTPTRAPTATPAATSTGGH